MTGTTGDRLDVLLVRREDGVLSADEERELADLLSTPEARRRIVAHYLLSEGLASAGARRGVRPVIAIAAVTVAVAAAAVIALVVRRPAPVANGGDPMLERVLAREGAASPVVREVPRFVVSDPPALDRPDPVAAASADVLELAQPRGLGEELAGTPASVVARLRGFRPDARQMFLANQKQFQCAAHQRHALDTLVVGSVLRNEGWVKEAWAVIDATFAHQRADGSFGDPPICVAVWLGSLGVALDTLERGPFAATYAPRIRALEPALARAAGFLARPRHLASLKRGGKETPTPDFVAAAALASVGARVREPELVAAAVSLADHGLTEQREDGAFVHQGGHDSAFQIHRTVQLHKVLATLPLERYRQAARRAGEWTLARVSPEGALDLAGNTHTKPCDAGATGCKYVSYRDLRWLIALHGARFDASVRPLAETVYRAEARRAR